MTAAMMKIAGYDVPPEIIFGVQLKPVTMDSCRTDIPPDGSPSSLVPPELQVEDVPGLMHFDLVDAGELAPWRRPPVSRRRTV